MADDDRAVVQPSYPLLTLLAGLVAGTLVPEGAGSAAIGVALGLAAFICLAAVARPRGIDARGLAASAFAAGAALAAHERAHWAADSLPALAREFEGPMRVTGRLESDARVEDGDAVFDLRAQTLSLGGRDLPFAGRLRVRVRKSADGAFLVADRLRAGDQVSGFMDLRPPEPVRTPGGFDQRAWAEREGLNGFASCKSERLLMVIHGAGVSRWSDLGRRRLTQAFRHVAVPENRAVAASMVLGDEAGLDRETREDFRAAGLLHLLVVSGSQVVALIYALRRLLPLRARLAWWGAFIEAAAVTGYALVAGAGDSIMRAAVMSIGFSVASRLDLRGGGVNALCAAAIVLLTARPLDARDPGAQLSFAATLSLIVWARPLSERLRLAGVPEIVADALAATICATLAVTPVALHHFHRLSLVAIPANLLAAPLSALLLYTSIVIAILDLAAPVAAALAGFGAEILAQGLRDLASTAAAMDPDLRISALSLPALPALIACLPQSAGRRRILLAASFISWLSESPASGDGRLHAWFLDVGQGDALVLQLPDGDAAVVDAGPAFEDYDAGERVVAPALWALGHSRIAFLAITHRHADHAGGAPFLRRHFRPARVFVNGPDGGEDATSRVLSRGDEWMSGGVRFRVLAPSPAWVLESRDENARSLVIEVTFGEQRLLLMGDAGRRVEALLDPPLHDFAAVKVGHHGAADASSDEFIRRTRARLAVISVGDRNRFGHPAARVVTAWSAAGARVLRTDRDHTAHVVVSPGGTKAEVFPGLAPTSRPDER